MVPILTVLLPISLGEYIWQKFLASEGVIAVFTLFIILFALALFILFAIWDMEKQLALILDEFEERKSSEKSAPNP